MLGKADALVSEDTFTLGEKLHKLLLTADISSQKKCSTCNTELRKTQRNDETGTVLFRCGHIFHYDCLNGSALCTVCNQADPKDSKSKKRKGKSNSRIHRFKGDDKNSKLKNVDKQLCQAFDKNYNLLGELLSGKRIVNKAEIALDSLKGVKQAPVLIPGMKLLKLAPPVAQPATPTKKKRTITTVTNTQVDDEKTEKDQDEEDEVNEDEDDEEKSDEEAPEEKEQKSQQTQQKGTKGMIVQRIDIIPTSFEELAEGL